MHGNLRCIRRILAVAILLLPLLARAERTVVSVKAESLTMREQPDPKAKKVATLVTFQPVKIIETKDKWTRVSTSEGKQGWVLSSYLSENAFIQVDSDRMNVRRGPGSEYAVIMTFGRHYPLRVLDVASNGWLKVMDYEKDRGWVHPGTAKLSPKYIITRFAHSNIRKTPGKDAEIAFTAEKGAIFEVLKVEKQPDGKEWLNVKYEDGDQGWIAAGIVFGWDDVEDTTKS
jgi:SH3-like domain-containing protein